MTIDIAIDIFEELSPGWNFQSYIICLLEILSGNIKFKFLIVATAFCLNVNTTERVVIFEPQTFFKVKTMKFMMNILERDTTKE